MKKIVIAGGGVGGYVALKKIKSLTKELNFEDYEITLIEKK
jgi:NADH dehydrogenase FAD-containing subunit